ncbi:MAG: hypothetical protein ACT4N1_00435 [Nitrososphaerota archaeon]
MKTIEKNKQVVRNFVEDVFNRHDMAAVDKYMAGEEGFKQYLGGFALLVMGATSRQPTR